MTSIERISCAFQHQESDKIPKGEPLIDRALILKLIGETTGDHFRDTVKVMEMLGMDMIGAESTFTTSPHKEMIGTHKSGRKIMKDGWGCVYLESEYGSLTPGLLDFPIKNIDDIHRYRFPPLSHYKTDEIERWTQETDYFIFACVWGGRDTACSLVGFENYMVYSKTHPQELKYLIERFTGYQAEVAKIYLDAGAHGIWLADDLAGNTGLFLSPEFYKQILFPCVRKEIKLIKDNRNVPVVLHTDGNINALLEEIAELGIDGLNPIEPHAGMDIFQVKQRYGQKLCLVGNIDTNYLLPRGKPGEVERVVRKTIQTCAPGGGFILASANMLTGDVPVENVLAMYKAAEEYGG